MKERESRPVRPERAARALIEGAFRVARELGVERLLVQADRVSDLKQVERQREHERVVWVSRGDFTLDTPRGDDDVIELPEVLLSRASQLDMALFMAALTTDLGTDDSVVCLSGPGSGGSVDTLTLTQPARRFPWLADRDLELTRAAVATPTVARVLSLALRLAAEGREGRPVGTVFVVGEPEQLEPQVRQLILNPCSGHPRRSRNVHNPGLFETIRELVAMDGALLVSPKGTLEAAGLYLSPRTTPRGVKRGLGARHAAAAGITVEHDPCVAIVVSESSGSVSVYHDGQAILVLQRPVLGSMKLHRPLTR
ncbi:MAG: diadenylate cyclase [Planctomycetota bacterium]